MARVHGIHLREVPPGPDEYATKHEALKARPNEVVVDAVFANVRSVEDAAFRVNANKRREWPSDQYYAAWKFNPEAVVKSKDDETPDQTGGWELLIGNREYMPESWRKTVEAPGSRKRRSKKETDEDGDEEYSDVA